MIKNTSIVKQGWLGAKDNIIHAGEGPVPIIRWAGTLVAWANNICVRVMACHACFALTSNFAEQAPPL